jgi:type VI secretion system protein ImpH
MGKFMVQIGPLDSGRFHDFLPDKDTFKKMGELVEFYLDEPLIWDTVIEIDRNAVKTTKIGDKHWSRLGWDTWLFSEKCSPEILEVTL